MQRSDERDGVDEVDAIVQQWRVEREGLDTDAMGLFGRLYRCALAAGEAMETTYGAYGITRADFDVLATIVRGGGPYRTSPGALCDSLMLSSGGMTRRLDRLERLGLIRREPDPGDRRGLLIAITEAGTEVVDEALVAGVETQEGLLGALTSEERAGVHRALRLLLRSVRSAGSVDDAIDG